MSGYIIMLTTIKILNMLDNFVTALKKYRVTYLRSAIHAILMMDSRCAIIAVQSERFLMPCHRPVADFPRRIPPLRGTMRAIICY